MAPVGSVCCSRRWFSFVSPDIARRTAERSTECTRRSVRRGDPKGTAGQRLRRLTAALTDVDLEIEAAGATSQDTVSLVDAALAAAALAASAKTPHHYDGAPPRVRRQINQGLQEAADRR
jgi:hypothetical protein